MVVQALVMTTTDLLRKETCIFSKCNIHYQYHNVFITLYMLPQTGKPIFNNLKKFIKTTNINTKSLNLF